MPEIDVRLQYVNEGERRASGIGRYSPGALLAIGRCAVIAIPAFCGRRQARRH
jgi:hypothetical protein